MRRWRLLRWGRFVGSPAPLGHWLHWKGVFLQPPRPIHLRTLKVPGAKSRSLGNIARTRPSSLVTMWQRWCESAQFACQLMVGTRLPNAETPNGTPPVSCSRPRSTGQARALSHNRLELVTVRHKLKTPPAGLGSPPLSVRFQSSPGTMMDSLSQRMRLFRRRPDPLHEHQYLLLGTSPLRHLTWPHCYCRASFMASIYPLCLPAVLISESYL